MTDRSTPQLHSLLEQQSFARRVARRFAPDGQRAEDLAQDALLIALTQADGEERRTGGWWGQLLKNLGRSLRRSEIRRTQREREVARHEADPAFQDSALPGADRQHLLSLVESLPAPYNEAIRLRFLEGLSVREAADRMDCLESTLCTRTAEGLRRLREALQDEQEPGRVSWLASVFLPLATSRRVADSPTATLSLLMGNSIKLVATLGVLAGLFFAVYAAQESDRPSLVRGEGNGVERRLQEGDLPLASRGAGVPQRASVSPAADRTAPASGFVHPPYDASHAREAQLVRGRVVDLHGQIVTGIDVLALPYLPHGGVAQSEALPEILATTDGSGHFELLAMPPTSLHAQSPRFATVYAGHVSAQASPGECVVVVGPAVELGGVVVNEAGLGIAPAQLQVYVTRRPLELAGDLLAKSTLVPRAARCDESGRFDFSQVAYMESAELSVQAPGYLDKRLEFPVGGDSNLRIELERAQAAPEMVTGQVVFESGEAAPWALVSAGDLSVVSDIAGFFALDLTPHDHASPEKEGRALLVQAALPGLQAARVEVPSVEASRLRGHRDPVLLKLGGPSLSIQGRVLDQNGEPLPDIAVRILEATPFGRIPNREYGWFYERTLEQLMGGGPTQTDAKGAFRLEGLLDREYRIEVLQRPSLLSAIADAVPAGTQELDVRLDLSLAQPLEGHVLDRHGEPIAGVRISVSRKWTDSLEIGAQDVSDSQGHFRIERATPNPAYFRIEGAAVVTELFYTLSEASNLQALELRAARRCSIQFDFGDALARADSLHAIDAYGSPVDMMYQQANVVGVRPTLPIGSGLSEVFALGDHVTQIVLTLGGQEVTRYPVSLQAGETLLLRL